MTLEEQEQKKELIEKATMWINEIKSAVEVMADNLRSNDDLKQQVAFCHLETLTLYFLSEHSNRVMERVKQIYTPDMMPSFH